MFDMQDFFNTFIKEALGYNESEVIVDPDNEVDPFSDDSDAYLGNFISNDRGRPADATMDDVKSMVDKAKKIFSYGKTFYYLPEVDNVKFYDKATVVFWKDHTKTVVIRQPEDQDDKEKALAMCFLKKLFGNKGNYNDIFRKYIPKEV